MYVCKAKAIPLQAWTGPEGSRRLKLFSRQSAHEGGKVVSPGHRPPLPPRKYSWWVKDLYVNLPIQNILNITKFWLKANNQNQAIIDDILHLLDIILGQNYFQYGSHFYQPNKGIAMGSPISSTLAEIYLQYFEKIHLKHHLETKDNIYYKRYVDDLFIIYDQTKINEDTIHDIINNIDENLEFKITKEENHITIYLDFTIQRKHNEFEMSICRKPT
jgi:hypothetical protein